MEGKEGEKKGRGRGREMVGGGSRAVDEFRGRSKRIKLRLVASSAERKILWTERTDFHAMWPLSFGLFRDLEKTLRVYSLSDSIASEDLDEPAFSSSLLPSLLLIFFYLMLFVRIHTCSSHSVRLILADKVASDRGSLPLSFPTLSRLADFPFRSLVIPPSHELRCPLLPFLFAQLI